LTSYIEHEIKACKCPWKSITCWLWPKFI